MSDELKQAEIFLEPRNDLLGHKGKGGEGETRYPSPTALRKLKAVVDQIPSDKASGHSADEQAELARRHAIQDREISQMIVTIERRRRFLRREGGGWRLAVQDAELARRFEELHQHPLLQKAIARIVAPPGMAPSDRISPEPAQPISAPSPEHVTQDQGKTEPAASRASKAIDMVPVPRNATTEMAVPAGDRVAASGSVAMSVQRIIEEKIRLKIGPDGQIDGEMLARQGIAIVEGDRADRRLLGRAREQADHARRVVTGFVKKAPGFIVEHDGYFSLSPNTKADIAMMAREHDSPAMQLVLQMVWQEYHANLAKLTPPSFEPIAPRLTTIERDDEMIAAAKAYQDEQRRHAAAAVAKESSATRPREGCAAVSKHGAGAIASTHAPSASGARR